VLDGKAFGPAAKPDARLRLRRRNPGLRIRPVNDDAADGCEREYHKGYQLHGLYSELWLNLPQIRAGHCNGHHKKSFASPRRNCNSRQVV
jgi:hypothetical protein